MRFLICYALLVSGFSTAFINTLPKINTKTKLNYKPSKMIEEVSKDGWK